MTSNQAQMNTFTGGLDLDSDVTNIKSNAYRYAENVRVVTNDQGTTGVLQNIEGVKKIYTINFETSGETVLGAVTINKWFVIVTKGIDGNNYIYRGEKLNENSFGNFVTLIKGQLNIGNNVAVPNISIVGNLENAPNAEGENGNAKVYITDGNGSIKVINIFDTSSYQVDDDGYLLYPESLDSTPMAELPPLSVTAITEGSLEAGVVQYCYQLFNVRGSQTVVSPLSGLIPIIQSTQGSNSTDVIGLLPEDISTKGVQLHADVPTNNFDYCRIYRIHFINNNTTPSIYTVDEVLVNNVTNSVDYIDVGSSVLNELTVEQFNSMTSAQFSAKTITSTANMLFAANIEDKTFDVDYDARAYRSNSGGNVTLLSSTGTDTITFSESSLTTDTVPESHDCIQTDEYKYATVNGTRVLGGAGINVSYKFITTKIQLTDSQSTGTEYRLSNNCQMGVSSRLQNYLVTTVLGQPSEQTNTVFGEQGSSHILNYADEIIASKFLGYQRDEVYRFGIIFYNSKSIPSPVHWIADIKMPSSYEAPTIEYDTDSSSAHYVWGNVLGIRFTVNNIPDEVTGYEIVRCDRTEADRTILMQVATSNVYEYKLQDDDAPGEGTVLDSSMDMRCAPFLTGSNMTISLDGFVDSWPGESDSGEQKEWNKTGFIDGNARVNGYVKLVSPEICVQGSSIESYFNNQTRLKRVCALYSPIYVTLDGTASFGRLMFHPINQRTRDKYLQLSMRSVQARRVFANDSSSLQYTGEYGTHDPQSNFVCIPSQDFLDLTNWDNGYIVNYNGELTGQDEYGRRADIWIQFPSRYSGNENNQGPDSAQQFYPAMIAKYYVPIYIQDSDSTYNISDVVYPPMIPYNAYSEGLVAYRVNIGERTFVNFNTGAFGYTGLQGVHGPSGPCLIAYNEDAFQNFPQSTVGEDSTFKNKYSTAAVPPNDFDTVNAITIANVVRTLAGQYGGNTYTAKMNSIYIPTGAYAGNETASVDVYGGDTYICILDYPVTYTFQNNYAPWSGESAENWKDSDAWLSAYVGAYIPFETSINTNLLSGDMFFRGVSLSNNVDPHIEYDITQKGTFHVQDKPNFEYNTVYSAQNGAKQFVSSYLYSQDSNIFGNRIYASSVKTANEITDSWTMFQEANYLDVDVQYGNITNLIPFKDRLFFFQDEAVGIASVNERSVINDGNVGQLTLGTGDVLARYDYISNTNGSSIINDRSIVRSDNLLYWYDIDKNEICELQGDAILTLSKTKNVQTYLNDKDVKTAAKSMFDKKYNEVWMIFDDKSLIFSEQLDCFTSFYTFKPDYTLKFSDGLYTIYQDDIYKVNDLDTTDTISRNAKIQTIVNQDPDSTKVFDNIRTSAVFEDGDGNTLITSGIGIMEFTTKKQSTGEQNIAFDYREDTYRLPIPRQTDSQDTMSFAPRMRGKYLICDYNFTVNGEQIFRIPYIATTYRYSNI